MSIRFKLWLLLLGCSSLAAFGYSQVTPVFDAPDWRRISLFAAIGVTGLLMVFFTPAFMSWRRSVLGIWLPAVLLRVLLLPTAPSDDVNRYLWEGKLIQNGISPYTQRADDASIAEYRDSYWAAINHKDKPTAYPPISELAFAGVGAVVYHPLAYKVVFVLADLLTLAAVLCLLRARGLGLQYAGFYAFSPIVLISYAGEAHFDALMVMPLVWALWAYESGRVGLAVVLASLATGVKWVTLPLIPFFAGKRLWMGAVLSVATLLLPAVFFWSSLSALIDGLLQFGSTRSFNGPMYDVLFFGWDLPRAVCTRVVVVLLSVVIVWRWLMRDSAPLDSHIRWILGTLIVLSPTVHFWYIAWILPFVCLRPSLPWITFSVSACAYFYVWTNAATDVGWTLTAWQKKMFWLPFFIACNYELWSTRGVILWTRCRSSKHPDATVAVVIPTLNAAVDLPQALASITAQTRAVDEVIIVDAGSEDTTRSIASQAALPIQVLSSERGRGLQIATGIEASTADWVLVLHADALLASNAVACVLCAVERDSSVIGGALGQRFMETNIGLLPIELLNDMRALFTRTAFGDQVQFFHRATAVRYDLVPKQPLMEDVESSWRTRERGGFLFLGQDCPVSHQKWQREGWFRRVKLVLRLVALYRFARLRGRDQAEQLSRNLYRDYYPKRK